MEENRLVDLQDKRGTKDCPNLFANIVMKVPNTMATVSGKSHKKVSVTSLSKEEAISLHSQLGELIAKDVKENPEETQGAKDLPGVPNDITEEEAKEADERVAKEGVIVGRGMGKSGQPFQELSGVKDGNMEPNSAVKEKVETQRQTETTKEEGSDSERKSETSSVS